MSTMAPPRTPRDELMTDADDLRPAVLAAPRDEAADLGGADIERCRQIPAGARVFAFRMMPSSP